jgi:hypothetical protein
MNVRRSAALLLAVLLALPLFAGCSGGTDTKEYAGTDGGGTPHTDAPKTEDTTEDTKVLDAVPELDFGGAAFRTLEQSTVYSLHLSSQEYKYEELKYSFWTEDQVGEKVNDAIYDRNRAMEERFRISIEEPTKGDTDTVKDMIVNTVLGAMDEYDLTFYCLQEAPNLIVQGVFTNWSTIPYVDLDNPWYMQQINNVTINATYFVIESDLNLGWSEQTWMIIYNKSKATDYNVQEDLYQRVRDGKWTLDYMMEITESVYTDLNGNGARDEEDFYGMLGLYDGPPIAAFTYGCEAPMIVLNDDYTITQTVRGEKYLEVIGKLTKLFNESGGSWLSESASKEDRVDRFVQGNLLFSPMMALDLTGGDLRDFKDDFGVLPPPKYDEDQEAYHTIVNIRVPGMIVLKSAQNTEMIGAVVEAMSAYSHENVLPVYVNEALELRGTRDPESVEMLQLVLDARTVDYGYLYDAGIWMDRMRNLIKNDAWIGSPIAYIEERLEKYEDKFYVTIDYLLDYED